MVVDGQEYLYIAAQNKIENTKIGKWIFDYEKPDRVLFQLLRDENEIYCIDLRNIIENCISNSDLFYDGLLLDDKESEYNFYKNIEVSENNDSIQAILNESLSMFDTIKELLTMEEIKEFEMNMLYMILYAVNFRVHFEFQKFLYHEYTGDRDFPKEILRKSAIETIDTFYEKKKKFKNEKTEEVT